ncbi:MAG: acetate kinase, partial [Monoglobales bacterium]
MKVLVINAGSSSLKYQLIDMATQNVMAKGNCERIGIDGSFLKHKPTGKDDFVLEKPIENHQVAISIVLDALCDSDHGVISSLDEIAAVGHRVVHGGEFFKGSVIIDDSVKESIRKCFDLAPLHNPANLIGIEACEKAMNVPMVAVFDTAFHQTMPESSYMFA